MNSGKKKLQILFVENSPEDIALITAVLGRNGFDPSIKQVETAEEMQIALNSGEWDAILCDHSLPRFDSTEALKIFEESNLEIPFIIISGTIDETLVAKAMRAGADDYLNKNNLVRLAPIIERELQQIELRRKHRAVEQAIKHSNAQTIRYQETLLQLSSKAKPDFQSALKEILQADAMTLGVERASYWSLRDNGSRLVCEALYLKNDDRWECGKELRKVDFPSYFACMETNPLLVTNNVHTDPRTSQFAETYLNQIGIISKLNVPVWLEGKLQGIVCHGQIGLQRDWTEADQKFAISIGHMVSLALGEQKRKTAEAALQRSQQDYGSLVNSVEGIVWEADAQTFQFTFVSHEAERLLGYPLHRWTSEPTFWKDQIHPEDQEWAVNFCLSSTAQGKDHSFEYRMIAADGRTVWLRDLVKVVSENGKPSKLRGIMVEISAEKQNDRRRVVFTSLMQKLNLTTTPKAAARIIMESADELFGLDACSFDLYSADPPRLYPILNLDTVDGSRIEVPAPYGNYPPNDFRTNVLKQGGQLILRSEPANNTEKLIPFGNTSRPSASLIFVPVRNGSNATGILSIQSYKPNAYKQEDVEVLQSLADHCGGALERIAAQEAQSQLVAALEAQQKRLDDLLANVPGLVWEAWVDPHSKSNFTNRYFETLLGYDQDEWINQPNFWISIVHPEDRERVAQKSSEILARSGQGTDKFRWIAKDGRVVWVEAQFKAICDDIGKPIGLRGVTIDISERLQLEAQLRQSQKMESVGQLAGGIAHDFNNILTVIQGHSSLLSAGELNEMQNESTEQIARAAERAAKLTRQLLTFSRRQVMQTRALDLNEVVSNISKMLRSLVGEDVALQVNYASATPMIYADTGMMEQLIMNLSVNSRDAMPKGGQLTISTSTILIDHSYTQKNSEALLGEAVCLTISDTGCGISPEHLPRLYEPFFTTKSVGQGTGLGLATVYGIVKQHRGWIKLQTEVGKGTTFQIYFPSSKEKKSMNETATEDSAVRGGNETILVVEDEEPLRKMVNQILRKFGYFVLEADSGVSALKIYKQNKKKINLLLTDMVMPDGMTGRELAEIVQFDQPEIKVIYTSGYNAEIVGKDFELHEGLNFLQKPYPPKKLAKAVRDCLDKVAA